MKELGTVKEVDGKVVIVGISMHEGCESCSNSMCKSSRSALKAYNASEFALSEGDEVEIEVKSGEQARGAFWVLGLPLGALFAGYGLGRLFFPGTEEGPSVLSAGILFAIFLGIGLLVQRGRALDSLPVIVRKLEGLI